MNKHATKTVVPKFGLLQTPEVTVTVLDVLTANQTIDAGTWQTKAVTLQPNEAAYFNNAKNKAKNDGFLSVRAVVSGTIYISP